MREVLKKVWKNKGTATFFIFTSIITIFSCYNVYYYLDRHLKSLSKEQDYNPEMILTFFQYLITFYKLSKINLKNTLEINDNEKIKFNLDNFNLSVVFEFFLTLNLVTVSVVNLYNIFNKKYSESNLFFDSPKIFFNTFMGFCSAYALNEYTKDSFRASRVLQKGNDYSINFH